MKLFAIVTAGLMAVAGSSYYFFGSSDCSKGRCGLSSAPAPVATTGGCCPSHDESDCCARQDECCALQEACCAVATSASASVKTPDCCAKQEDCCLVSAACCAAVSVKAAAKPVELDGCCGASVVTPTRTVSDAARSIASVK